MGNKIDIQKTGVVLIVILLVGKFLLQPWGEWVDTVRSTIESRSQLENKQKVLVTNKQKIIDTKLKLEKTYSSKIENLPSYTNENTLPISWLKSVEEVAINSKLVITNKKPDRSIKITDAINIFNGSIVLKGETSRVLEFLAYFDESDVHQLRSVDIRKNLRSNNNEMIIEAEIQMMFKKS
ncbi:hypothetical protein L0668_09990 [Paraglaciecola aquimarina]|uniref:Uncharacterized protein n=1 Tax=Paraglaciecola algarum TaxID=3050085 RepID=A0ABS9D7S6_9ALTE|nr:hypothetical protein [Paraglaciecola sp. G1-23]MCF2948437.1 hypothetical protein [Paraglaciecola sp. G1-23]